MSHQPKRSGAFELRLRELHKIGVSFSQIAKLLTYEFDDQINKNIIAGYVNRWGLCKPKPENWRAGRVAPRMGLTDEDH